MNLPQTGIPGGTLRAGLLVPLACALLFTGCNSRTRTSSAGAQVQLVRPVKMEPVADRQLAQPARGSKSVTHSPEFTAPVRRGLEKEELNRFFRTVAVSKTVPSKAAVSKPAPRSSVIPDPGWDVPLTATWRHLVIHHSASLRGSAASFHREHLKRGWDGLGYHFVIGNGTLSSDGEVEIGFRWSQQKRGAHAGNKEYNLHGIGICLVGNFEEQRPTSRQLANLKRLVKFLQQKTGIPSSRIIGHRDVPNKDTRCPGRYFGVSRFRSTLGSASVRSGAEAGGKSSASRKWVSRSLTNASALP